MSRPSLEFITSWYSLSRQAMSCLAFCRASSSPASLHLASFWAASPCCSASARAASSLQRWGRKGEKRLRRAQAVGTLRLCGDQGLPWPWSFLVYLHSKWSIFKLTRQIPRNPFLDRMFMCVRNTPSLGTHVRIKHFKIKKKETPQYTL